MVKNSLDLDPNKRWKGIWRWNCEENLECITPERLITGITLQDFTHLANRNQLSIQSFSCDEQSYHIPYKMQSNACCINNHYYVKKNKNYQNFLDFVIASSRRQGLILVTNFSRQQIDQTGDGHFSPIAGYSNLYVIYFSNGEDYALCLDVARFKYPAYWLKIRSLYDSMSTLDQDSKEYQFQGRFRGFSLISRNQAFFAPICQYTLDYEYMSINSKNLKQDLQKYEIQTIQEYVIQKLQSFDQTFRILLIPYLYKLSNCLEVSNFQEGLQQINLHFGIYSIIDIFGSQLKEKLFQEIQNLNLYKIIQQALQNADKQNIQILHLIEEFQKELLPEIVTLLFLGLPQRNILDNLSSRPLLQKEWNFLINDFVLKNQLQTKKQCLILQQDLGFI